MALWRMQERGSAHAQKNLAARRGAMTVEMRAAARASASVLTETVSMVTQRMTREHKRCVFDETLVRYVLQMCTVPYHVALASPGPWLCWRTSTGRSC